jgi:6-pyruvoyltetrahydropterin/6-carboxytetrahydropterin synthase
MKDTDRFNMRFKLWKDFRFEGSHFLTQVPEGHQCGRMHGHSYRVRVHAMGHISRQVEWVVDYAEIAEAARPIIAALDHRVLNDVMPIETTAENLAFWIGQQLAPHKWLHAVEVFETPDTSVLLEVR